MEATPGTAKKVQAVCLIAWKGPDLEAMVAWQGWVDEAEMVVQEALEERLSSCLFSAAPTHSVTLA
jgi:hypothetical protein